MEILKTNAFISHFNNQLMIVINYNNLKQYITGYKKWQIITFVFRVDHVNNLQSKEDENETLRRKEETRLTQKCWEART